MILEIPEKYNQALDYLKVILNSQEKEYASELEEDTPIEHLKFRIKSIDSINEKLLKGKKIKDIVGARIVCSFESDASKVIARLKANPLLKVLEEKDYFSIPKENGYSSYHLIVGVQCVVSNKLEYVPVEIQIRTLARDLWACLDHVLLYKKNIDVSNDIVQKILDVSSNCLKWDKELNDIYIRQRNKKELKLFNESACSEWVSRNREEFTKMLSKYDEALKKCMTEINTLYNLYADDREREYNPIEHISSRIKPSKRIIKKTIKKTGSLSIKLIEEEINDIAGIRIVCPFQSDLFEVVDYLEKNHSWKILNKKDYVTNPKESGYAGYHLIIGMPLGNDMVKIEIEIRTIAMDMWACLEHKLCYQKELDEIEVDTKQALLDLAKKRYYIDDSMEKIKTQINRTLNNKRRTLFYRKSKKDY